MMLSQIELSCLSVPEFQSSTDSLHDAMELEVFSRAESSCSTKAQTLQCAHQSVEHSVFANAVMEASDVCPADFMDSGDAEEWISQSAFGQYEPERISRTGLNLPPRRFFRTFWRSISLRLLKRSVGTNSVFL